MCPRQSGVLAFFATIAIGCATTTTTPRGPADSDLRGPSARASSAALDDAAVLDRDALVCAVLAHNPEVDAASEALAAARASVRRPVTATATRLDFSIAPASIGRDVPFGYVVEVGQSFRLGQRRLERDVASAEAESYAHRRDSVRNELALASASLFDDHFALARALETNAHHHALTLELVEAAKRRYAAGLVSAQDPLQAELELVRIEQERIELEAEQEIVVARTNRLLHRPPQTPLPPAPDRLGDVDEDAAAADVRDEALATRPELRIARSEAEARTRAARLARRRFAPDLSAMASYNSMWADPEHRFMIGVGLMIPLQLPALRAGVEQAQAEARRAQRVVESERDRVGAEVEEARARLSAARRVAQLHRERMVPTARERVEAARIGYETNANDIGALIDAERELRAAELEAQRALAQVDRRRAELEWAIGRVPCAGKEGTR